MRIAELKEKFSNEYRIMEFGYNEFLMYPEDTHTSSELAFFIPAYAWKNDKECPMQWRVGNGGVRFMYGRMTEVVGNQTFIPLNDADNATHILVYAHESLSGNSPVYDWYFNESWKHKEAVPFSAEHEHRLDGSIDTWMVIGKPLATKLSAKKTA